MGFKTLGYTSHMGRVVIVIAVILLTIYCVVEVAQSDRYSVRNAPRWLWAFAVICLPVVGPLAWLFLGRPNGGSGGKPQQPPRMPDDDPDFLRRL